MLSETQSAKEPMPSVEDRHNNSIIGCKTQSWKTIAVDSKGNSRYVKEDIAIGLRADGHIYQGILI